MSLYLFAALNILQALLSFLSGVRFFIYVKREINKDRSSGFKPLASVILPCRGLDQSLEENIRALFLQDYSTYEIIFVVDNENDPALVVIEKVMLDFKNIKSRILIAGQATTSGQKIHNLITAVKEIDQRIEVLVFVDSDARPQPQWLKSLVEPLADTKIGATTGYRWFIPVNGGLASHLRSVWNASIASALGENHMKNFCWGGSTAIRRELFEKLNILDHWEGNLSDDFILTRELLHAKFPIHFVPQCLVASFEDCSWRELGEFTTRQMKITRVYAPHIWRTVFLSGLLFVPFFWTGLIISVTGSTSNLFMTMMVAIYILGTAKAFIRERAISISLKSYREELAKNALAQYLLWPMGSTIFLYNCVLSIFSNRIVWRGLTYRLKSTKKADIIRRDIRGSSI
jgi:ceramide glucosyltransferase